MEIKSNKINGANAEIKATISMDEVNANLEKIARELAKTANVQGFRKGKVPVSIIKKQYGGSIAKHVSGFTRKRNGNLWRIYDRKALAFLNDIAPYVVIKKRHVMLGILFQKLKQQRKKFGCSLSSDEIAQREQFYQAMKTLNSHKTLPSLPRSISLGEPF